MINPTIKCAKCAVLAVLSLPAGISYAQEPAQTAPSSKPREIVITPLDLQKAAREMQKDLLKNPPSLVGTINGPSPYDVDIPLPPQGISAIQQANKFLYLDEPPTVDQDGWVTYRYGRGYPLVILKPEQISTIRLGKGEFLRPGELPDIGNTKQIHAIPRIVGSGEDAQTFLLLKCEHAGEASDVVFGTNKRLYTIRVISKPMDYTPRVAFSYPDDEEEQAWRAYAEQRRVNQQSTATAQETKSAYTALKVAQAALEEERRNAPPVFRNTNYDIQANRKEARAIWPRVVGDDGFHTYIRLPDNIAALDQPDPKVWSDKGQVSPNYRYKGSLLIIDAVFRRCELVSGAGHRQHKITITNKVPLSSEVRSGEVQSARR